MSRCIACDATLVGTRCPSCSPRPQPSRTPPPPDPQRERAWRFFTHRGWRYAAFAVPITVAASVYVAVVDGDTGGSVFFALGALAYGAYGVADWRNEHLG